MSACLDGVVSLRHSHNFRFGQGDLYVVIKLVTEGGEARPPINIDPHELQDARWMSRYITVTGRPLDKPLHRRYITVTGRPLDEPRGDRGDRGGEGLQGRP